MQEVYLNNPDGTIILGQAAMDDFLESSQGHYEIDELSEILSTGEPPETSIDTAFDIEDWQRDDYAKFGRWLIKYFKYKNMPDPITFKNLRMLYRYGLGPEAHRFQVRFGSIWQYRRYLGQDIGRDTNRYKGWTPEDFTSYARDVDDMCEGRPTRKFYEELAFQGKGPSPKQIDTVVGGVGWLNESIGYPNVKQWDIDDYIQWGVYARIANNGAELTNSLVEILARRQRGPWPRTLEQKFEGSIQRYQGIVEEYYQEHLSYDAQRLENAKKEIAQGILPIELAGAADESIMAAIGAYKLLISFNAQDDSRVDRAKTAQMALTLPPHRLSQHIVESKKDRNTVNHDVVERQAVILRVYDDIWPFQPPYYPYLKISPEDMPTQNPWYLREYYNIT